MNAILNILNGLVGFFLAVLLVVAAAVIVGYNAIKIQHNEAQSYYRIDTQILQKNNIKNHEAITDIKDKK